MTERPSAAGAYILAGGASRRMGRDKALIAWRGSTVIEHIAIELRQATGSVTVVAANAAPYAALGLDTIGERYAGQGPISGIEAALRHTTHEYNLVVACDMPLLTGKALGELLRFAQAREALVCAARSQLGVEPLCAVYRRRLLDDVVHAIERGERKMLHLLAQWKVTEWTPADAELTRNLNEPADWDELLRAGS